MKRKYLLYIAVLCFSGLVLISCYSRHPEFFFDPIDSAVQCEDQRAIIFIATSGAWRSAVGITSFPDGGTPKYLLQEMNLFYFIPEKDSLVRLYSFDDLVKCGGAHRSNWKQRLAIKDDKLYCSVQPVAGWELLSKKCRYLVDSVDFATIKQKYSQVLVMDIKDKKTSFVEMDFPEISKHDSTYISIGELKKKLARLPVVALGLDIKQIYPKSAKAYMDEVIYLKNKSPLYQRAVIEQFIASKSKKEIEQLLNKMKKHENKLEGLEKMEYEIYSKDIYNMLEAML